MINEYDVKERLFEIVMKFINDNEIRCVESIAQCDWIIENAYEFIEDLYSTVEPILPNKEDEQ